MAYGAERRKAVSIRLLSKKKKAEEFERLAEECERQVYAACFHMMGNREDAMDCAQETMLRAFRAFDSFRGDASFSTWIMRIAMNACTDALRKRKNVVSLDGLREQAGFDPLDPAPTAYARLEEKERRALLQKALGELPDDMRQLIVLRDMQGMNYEDIAKTLNLPLGTVKSRLNRAREKISQLLQKSSELFSSSSV